MRYFPFAVITLTLASAALSAQQARPTIDLRYPENHGVTEIRFTWDKFEPGWQPRYVGDVDGDGHDDFFITQWLDSEFGTAWLVYGGERESFSSSQHLRELRKTEFLFFDDKDPGIFMGICSESITGLGDLDGDGLGDFMVPFCYRGWEGVSRTGGATIFFGSAEYPSSVDFGDPEVRHMRIISREAGAGFGVDALFGGDIDSDGLEDLFISARGVGTENAKRGAGRVFIIYGGFSTDHDIELSEIGGSLRGAVLTGAFGTDPPAVRTGDSLGGGDGCIATADVNGDGIDDLVVGAFRAARVTQSSGAIYVVYGGRDLPAELSVARPEEFGVEFLGVQGLSRTGHSIATPGDVDGDGIDDLLIGAPSSGGGFAGDLWLVYGSRDWPSSVRLDDPDLRRTRIRGTVPEEENFPFPNVLFGRQVKALGDLDRDGFADFFVGASEVQVNFMERAGAGYVIRGGPDLPRSATDRDIGRGPIDGLRIDGPNSFRRFGWQSGSAGDFDGDGLVDLLVTASNFHPPAFSDLGESSVFIFWGSELLEEHVLEIGSLEPAGRSATGGEEISLHGQGFQGTEQVFFGGREASDVRLISGAEIRVTVPPGQVGELVDVETRLGEASSILPNSFTYGPKRDFVDILLGEEWLRAGGHPFSRIDDYVGGGPRPAGNIRQLLPTYARDLDGDGSEELLLMEFMFSGDLRILVFPGGRRLPETLGPGEGEALAATVLGSVDGEIVIDYQLDFPGDIDGDGYQEIASGGELPGGVGRSLLVATGPDWIEAGGEVDLADVQSELIRGVFCGFATTVSLDLDGDGLPDLAHGGRNRCQGAAAKVLIFPGIREFSEGDRIAEIVIKGDPNEVMQDGEPERTGMFGYSLASGGDINGDGVDDLVISSSASRAGEVFVLFGSRDISDFYEEASILLYEEEGRVLRINLDRGANIGRGVAGGFDFNGDGIGDFAVAVEYDGRDLQGAISIIYGSTLYGDELRRLDIDADRDRMVRIEGVFDNDQLEQVTPLGDFNGDGFDDVGIVAASLTNPGARAYVVFGGETSPRDIDLRRLGTRGFEIRGNPGMRFSGGMHGLMSSGDFDGDGRQDLVLSGEENRKPVAWVLYGHVGPGKFTRGEANGDGRVDLSDAISILDYLFLGGRAPACLGAGDVNDSGSLDLSDPVYLLNFLFLGGPRPPDPFGEPGLDPTPDELGC